MLTGGIAWVVSVMLTGGIAWVVSVMLTGGIAWVVSVTLTGGGCSEGAVLSAECVAPRERDARDAMVGGTGVLRSVG
jgi:hypothetical protein